MSIRNRVVELRKVRAGDLLPDPRNFRRHPKSQRDALRTMLDRVGNADVLITRETPDGLMLVDGHLRADLEPNAEIPVVVTDLDEEEAGEVLATLDPLAAMAETDTDALQALVDDLSEQVQEETAKVLAQLQELPYDYSQVGTSWPDMTESDHPLGVMQFIVSDRQRKVVNGALSAAASDVETDDPDDDNGNRNGRTLTAWAIRYLDGRNLD